MHKNKILSESYRIGKGRHQGLLSKKIKKKIYLTKKITSTPLEFVECISSDASDNNDNICEQKKTEFDKDAELQNKLRNLVALKEIPKDTTEDLLDILIDYGCQLPRTYAALLDTSIEHKNGTHSDKTSEGIPEEEEMIDYSDLISEASHDEDMVINEFIGDEFVNVSEKTGTTDSKKPVVIKVSSLKEIYSILEERKKPKVEIAEVKCKTPSPPLPNLRQAPAPTPAPTKFQNNKTVYENTKKIVDNLRVNFPITCDREMDMLEESCRVDKPFNINRLYHYAKFEDFISPQYLLDFNYRGIKGKRPFKNYVHLIGVLSELWATDGVGDISTKLQEEFKKTRLRCYHKLWYNKNASKYSSNSK